MCVSNCAAIRNFFCNNCLFAKNVAKIVQISMFRLTHSEKCIYFKLPRAFPLVIRGNFRENQWFRGDFRENNILAKILTKTLVNNPMCRWSSRTRRPESTATSNWWPPAATWSTFTTFSRSPVTFKLFLVQIMKKRCRCEAETLTTELFRNKPTKKCELLYEASNFFKEEDLSIIYLYAVGRFGHTPL